MRLQLIAVVVVLSTAPAAAQVEPETRNATAGVLIYADDDHVTVWSPRARVAVPAPHEVVVDVETVVDAVTAASADVITAASPYAFEERRVEGGVGARLEIADHHWIGARAIVSDENDYTSLRLGALWLAELARRNATLQLEYTAAFDTVGRAGDPMFAALRRGHRATATLTQVTDRRGYIDLVLDVARDTGYLASPYRYVPITIGGMASYALPERVPDEHSSLAALVRLRREVVRGWYGHLDYRLCRDDWDLTSHTMSAKALHGLVDDTVLVGLAARGYLQSAASFFRASYLGDDGAPAWRTRDRTLGTARTLAISAMVDAVLPWRELRASGSLAVVRFWWPDDPIQRRRDAVISTLSVQLPF